MSTSQVQLYAKLKPMDELKRLLSHSVISDLYRLSLQNKDNMIKVRITSNPEVFVELTTGWTVYGSCIDYFVEPVSETLEATLDEDPSLTIPELNTEPTGDVEGTYGPNIAMYEDALKEYNESLKIKDIHLEQPFMMTKTMFNKVAIQRHRTHYIKLEMNPSKYPNLSFRFFYESEDNKHQEGKWFLKDHDKKASIEVNKAFIEKHFEDIVGAFEVIGRLMPKKGYMKIVKDIHTGCITEFKE